MNKIAIKWRDEIIKDLGLKVTDSYELGVSYDNSYHAYCVFVGKNKEEYCFSITPTSYVFSSRTEMIYSGFSKDKMVEEIKKVI